MRTQWQVKRTLIPRHDGQRRWDYASQFLLQWAVGPEAAPCSVHPDQQEDSNERRRICARLDQSATTDPDD